MKTIRQILSAILPTGLAAETVNLQAEEKHERDKPRRDVEIKPYPAAIA
jgi:hypothetical protein